MNMKKWLPAVLAALVLICGLFFLTHRTAVHIGPSEKFSRNELENAVSCLKKEPVTFRTVRYDEEQSSRILENLGVPPDSKNLIVICSEFKGKDGPHANYAWVLERQNSSDNWHKIDQFDLPEQ